MNRSVWCKNEKINAVRAIIKSVVSAVKIEGEIRKRITIRCEKGVGYRIQFNSSQDERKDTEMSLLFHGGRCLLRSMSHYT